MEKDKKLFFGGFKFVDIKTEFVVKENSVKERRKWYLKIVESFGKITEFREHWDKNFFFAVFYNKEDAKNCFENLKIFEKRKVICAKIKKELERKEIETINGPNPHFYVRWPKFPFYKMRKKKQQQSTKGSKNPNNNKIKNKKLIEKQRTEKFLKELEMLRIGNQKNRSWESDLETVHVKEILLKKQIKIEKEEKAKRMKERQLKIQQEELKRIKKKEKEDIKNCN